MTICKKCGKELKDGSKFCDNCGTQIHETIFCPNCGQENSAELVNCQSCGASLEVAQSITPTPQKKRISKKVIMVGLTGVMVIAILAVAIGLFGKGGAKSKNYALYLKDGEIFYNDFSEKGPQQITTRLYSGENDADFQQKLKETLKYLVYSPNGNLIIYPDKNGSEDDYGNLYYRYMGKPESSPVKIGSGVSEYTVSSNGKIVTYFTSNGLYQYNIETESKEKIKGNVMYFSVSDDGKRLYLLSQTELCLRTEDGKEERIDDDVARIFSVSDDFSTIYYEKRISKEPASYTLYQYKDGGEKKRIASGESVDIPFDSKTHERSIYETGELYYIKSNTETVPLMSIVEEDLKAEDEALAATERPVIPLRENYANWEDYELACDKYLEAYEPFEELDRRNRYREYYAEQKVDVKHRELFYFDGNESISLGEFSVNGILVLNMDIMGFAPDNPVVVYRKAAHTPIEFSELYEYGTAGAEEGPVAESALHSGTGNLCIAVKGEVTDLNHNAGEMYVGINPSGSQVSFIEAEKGDEIGDLYQIKIENGVPQQAEFYDSEVLLDWGTFLLDADSILYSKKDGEDTAILYMNGTQIADDVDKSIGYNPYREYYSEFGKVLFLTDYDWRSDRGTLNLYENGKAVKIADDVYDYSIDFDASGEITFFTEWDSENAIGTLNLYRNGETQKIADDVPDSVKETSQGDILFLYDVDFSAECAELGMYTDGKVQKVDSDVQFLLYSNPKKYKASLITSNKGI